MIFLLKLVEDILDGTMVNRRLMEHSMNVDVMVATSGGL